MSSVEGIAELAASIYAELGVARPQVRSFASIEEALASFPEWQPLTRGGFTLLWEQQYPILHPRSAWAQDHLFDDGFQFDIERTHNTEPYYFSRTFASEIPASGKELHHAYLDAAIDACRDLSPRPADAAVEQLFELCPDLWEMLDALVRQHEPSSPMQPEDHAVLGPFRWIQVEFEMLRAMRAALHSPVCDRHYQNVKGIHELDGLLLTFRDGVIAVPLPS